MGQRVNGWIDGQRVDGRTGGMGNFNPEPFVCLVGGTYTNERHVCV